MQHDTTAACRQKKFVKIRLKIQKLQFALAPFDPLYLRNGKSYVKSVGIPKEILIKESKGKNCIIIVQKINTLYLEAQNYQFQPVQASSFQISEGTPFISNPRLCFVARMILLNENWSTGIKLIAQKH